MKAQRSSLVYKESLDAILALIKSGTKGDGFAQKLRNKKIPHISFSQVAAVEFCEQRYCLDYVEEVQLDPLPNYFIKGKLLHQFIASSYLSIAKGHEIDLPSYIVTINHSYTDQHRTHLINAVQIHLDNLWHDYHILGVEEPFVMMVSKDLPPFVGVIDLLLLKDNQIYIVDHKTGNDFYAPDLLQMAIYYKYARMKFPKRKIRIYYDRYRWVNNLTRIRKPALLRSEIDLPPYYWNYALERIRIGYTVMNRIYEDRQGRRGGACYLCPYRQVC